MSHQAGNKKILVIFFIFVTALGLIACTREIDPLPRAWIDSPRGGTNYPPGEEVIVYSHAYASKGLAEVVLSIDGEAYSRSSPAEDGQIFSDFELEWLPPGEGSYILQLVAYDSDGERSSPVTIAVTVGIEEPRVVEVQDSPEEEEGQQEALTCPPLVTANTNANCRSGPGESYPLVSSLPSGSNASAVGQSVDGAFWIIDSPGGGGSCWIWDQLVTVSDETCSLPVVQAPPPPVVEDLTPPPAPQPAVPADGLALGCRSNQNLVWQPVDDPSGIAGYYLLLKKEVTPGSWQNVNQWGPIDGKQQAVPVDCGYTFNWSVRAEDGAGNFSPWSSPSAFTVNLE